MSRRTPHHGLDPAAQATLIADADARIQRYLTGIGARRVFPDTAASPDGPGLAACSC